MRKMLHHFFVCFVLFCFDCCVCLCAAELLISSSFFRFLLKNCPQLQVTLGCFPATPSLALEKRFHKLKLFTDLRFCPYNMNRIHQLTHDNQYFTASMYLQ